MMSFLENARKPAGLCGKIMLSVMNLRHRALSEWGRQFLSLSADAKVLDCGCGGGANLKKLLELCPKGVVTGMDCSALSVEKTRKVNRRAVAAGRCMVWQGSVEKMAFEEAWFDAVTAFETVYFWPELSVCFREVYRVLKSGGMFLICNKCGGDEPADDKWTERIDGMTIYTDAQLKAVLEQVGFGKIQIHKNAEGCLCVTAEKMTEENA